MTVPLCETNTYNEGELLVPDAFLADSDKNIDSTSWRMRVMDKSGNDPMSVYNGDTKTQAGLLVQENAAARLAREKSFTYRALSAAHRIRHFVRDTPLVQVNDLVTEADVPVYLKLEHEQYQNSFKIRGAANAILSLSAAELANGIVSASAGNHIQGVARVAGLLGAPVRAYMSRHASAPKVRAAKELGAEIVQVGDDYDAAHMQLVTDLKHGLQMSEIHAYDDWRVMAGQASLSVEILQQQPDIQEWFWAAGGGGLASWNAAVGKEYQAGSREHVYQLEGGDALVRSVKRGMVVMLNKVNQRSDGTAVKRPGNKPMDLIYRFVDRADTVSEIELAHAMVELEQTFGRPVEAAGAIAFAGMKKYARFLRGPAVATVSGGNPSEESRKWAQSTAGNYALAA